MKSCTQNLLLYYNSVPSSTVNYGQTCRRAKSPEPVDIRADYLSSLCRYCISLILCGGKCWLPECDPRLSPVDVKFPVWWSLICTRRHIYQFASESLICWGVPWIKWDDYPIYVQVKDLKMKLGLEFYLSRNQICIESTRKPSTRIDSVLV